MENSRRKTVHAFFYLHTVLLYPSWEVSLAVVQLILTEYTAPCSVSNCMLYRTVGYGPGTLVLKERSLTGLSGPLSTR